MMDNAKWVGCYGEEAPKIRRKIHIKEDVDNAQIEICGLGMFKLFINGNSATDEVFPQLWSDYHKREFSNLTYKIDVKSSHRIYVSNYNITQYIKTGENVCAVILGNGWYNQTERIVEGNMSYGKPMLCYRLIVRYKSGECEAFVSDESLKWEKSHIIFNNLYLGEIQDLRLYDEKWMLPEFDDSHWKSVEIKENPDTVYDIKKCDGDRIIRTIKPILIAEIGNKKIYDCNENITGWIKVKAYGEPGRKIKIEYAEEICSDNSLNFESAGGEEQKQRDVYICNGKECVCEPNFTWHGFRYFSLEGPSLPVECVVVHTPVENKTEFECDNEILNWIYDSYVRTQLDNMHMGVPSDCPHRERLGYTGDGQLACGAAMYILDTKDFYYKWIRDILDCQDINTGRIQHTAPFYGGGGGSGGWGCAVVVVPYNHYKHFFDKNVLIESYPYMKKWVEYMFTQTEDDLVVFEEKDAEINPDYWGLGDWCTPEAVEIPKAFVNTYYLIKSLMYMKEIACIINEKFDYESKLSDFKKALVRKYFDNDTHTFFKSVQGADAFALDIDLGDEETEKKLLKKYSAADGFDTGIFGTYVLINVLFKRGYADEAVRLLTSEGKNSFGNMMKAGATTLWERWDSLWSHNHPMFGAVVEHIFSYLIGIRFENFKKIIIEPQYTHLIKRIKATVKTNTGAIEIEHKLCGDMCRTKINVYCKEEVLFLYNDEKYTVMDTLNIVKKIKY